jgi:hypothetical protein
MPKMTFTVNYIDIFHFYNKNTRLLLHSCKKVVCLYCSFNLYLV